MNSTHFSILAGALIGLVMGSSMGIAFGGGAVSGVYVFGPIGALLGWLAARKVNQSRQDDEVLAEVAPQLPVCSTLERIVHSILRLLAVIWNSHISLLSASNLLPTFVRQPWLFFALAVLLSFVFPPFLAIYFCAYLGAAQFGANEENGYKAAL